MSESETTVTPNEKQAETTEGGNEAKRHDTKPKRQPPYAVVLHNDDYNGMEFVVRSLRKVFHYGRIKAMRLMWQAHVSGRCIVWTGMLEVAELKADQLRSCGADPSMKAFGASTLSVTIEALPDA